MIRFSAGWIVQSIVFSVIVSIVVSLAPSPESEPEIEALPLATRGEAGEPHLTLSPDGGIVASWIEREDGLARLVWSKLEDQSWSPSKVIAQGEDWFVNWADVPSITVGANGRMMAHWLSRLGSDRYAYGVRVSVSQNAGQSWSEPIWLHDDRSQTEHGFVSAVTVSQGYLVSWLDGNGYGTGRNEMSVHSRTVSWEGEVGEEMVIDTRTCDCCPTSLILQVDGSVLSFYRDRSEAEVRDIAVSRWQDGSWSEPKSVHDDGWMINACPVNGPASDALDGMTVVAWFSAAGGSPSVFVAFSKDNGEHFSDPVQVDQGRPTGRVAVRMMADGNAAVTWIEGGGEETGFLMQVVSPGELVSGENHGPETIGRPIRIADTSSARSAGYPRIERDGDNFVALWTRSGSPSSLHSARISWN